MLSKKAERKSGINEEGTGTGYFSKAVKTAWAVEWSRSSDSVIDSRDWGGGGGVTCFNVVLIEDRGICMTEGIGQKESFFEVLRENSIATLFWNYFLRVRRHQSNHIEQIRVKLLDSVVHIAHINL